MRKKIILQLNEDKMFTKTRHNPVIIIDFECKTTKYTKEAPQLMGKLEGCVLLLCYPYSNNKTSHNIVSMLSLHSKNIIKYDDIIVLNSERAVTLQKPNELNSRFIKHLNMTNLVYRYIFR